MFREVAQQLTGRGEYKKPRRSFLTPLLSKLRGKSAQRRKAS
jgi:pilus assembly protein CpaE